MEDPDSFPPPPMFPPGMEGMVPPPPPPRHVGKYPPPPPFKPAGLPGPPAPLPSSIPLPTQSTEDIPYSDESELPPGMPEEYPAYQEPPQFEEDPLALPVHKQQDEQQYVRPEYNVHPMLRKPEDSAYRPYKRKGAPASPPRAASSSSSTSSSYSFPAADGDDDIRPNLALYQQGNKPQPYVPKAYKPVLPSREEASVGTYHSKGNPFENASSLPNRGAGGGGHGIGPGIGPRAGPGAGGIKEKGPDTGVGVASYTRRTFTLEESREKRKQMQESATNITNNVVASIREKLAGGGKISKGQAKILNRDQEIVSSIAMPTYVSHRTGSGLTQEEIKKAQDEHTRKLLGWKYHVAVKSRNEQALETKRQKK